MKTYKLLGVKIDSISYDETLEFILSKIKQNRKAKIATVNNEFIVEAQKNHKFKAVLNKSNLCLPDSTGVVWAIKYLYKEKIERVTGADLTLKLCNLCAQHDLRIYLLGGRRGVGLMAKNNLMKKFPGIHIVGYNDSIKLSSGIAPASLITEINRAKPNIILVALGAPKQELWIANNFNLLRANIFIGVGGTLDYISGRVKRAPEIMRKAGLEWLFRLIVQPSRILRIFRATIVFPYLVILSRLKNQKI